MFPDRIWGLSGWVEDVRTRLTGDSMGELTVRGSNSFDSSEKTVLC